VQQKIKAIDAAGSVKKVYLTSLISLSSSSSFLEAEDFSPFEAYTSPL